MENVLQPANATAAPADSQEPIKPDVMSWNDGPARQPSLIFGALAGPHPDRTVGLAT